jgi:hypothetical protein
VGALYWTVIVLVGALYWTVIVLVGALYWTVIIFVGALYWTVIIFRTTNLSLIQEDKITMSSYVVESLQCGAFA